MQAIWDRSPREFQKEAIPRLLMMRCPPHRPEAMLLVQGTGGGKSAVAQTVGSVECGVTLVIEATLALAADQRSKVAQARNTYGPVLAYQLDSIKKPHLITKLRNKLSGLGAHSNITLFIYSSPEYLIREHWRTVFHGLINRKVLKLVCVDEVHLFVMFGVTFRKEFTLLKESFFQHLIATTTAEEGSNNNGIYLKIPLLFMTATFNSSLLGLLNKMTGVVVSPSNYLWSSRTNMARRNIRINVDFTTQRLRCIKLILEDTLSGNLDKKCIVYTNTSSCLDQMQADVELWLDMNENIKGDVIVIYGDLKPEVKFVSAERFTKIHGNPEELINNNLFYPRILLATAGSIGAGLDSPDVYSVCRAGFPTSIFEMAQEMGRCGRGRSNDTGTVTDNFYLLLSCDDYIYLNTRLYKTSTPVPRHISPMLSIAEERDIQQQNLLHLLKMIVLKGECWHLQLEQILGNPLEPPSENLVPCGVSCPKCNNETKEYIMPVSRAGVSQFLADTFINNPSGLITTDILIKKITEYPNVGKIIYNRPRSVKAPAIKFVNVTVLQLIASGLIRIEVNEEESKCYCRLVVNNLCPAYLNESIWDSMFLLEEKIN